jgi:hypothetical protein
MCAVILAVSMQLHRIVAGRQCHGPRAYTSGREKPNKSAGQSFASRIDSIPVAHEDSGTLAVNTGVTRSRRGREQYCHRGLHRRGCKQCNGHLGVRHSPHRGTTDAVFVVIEDNAPFVLGAIVQSVTDKLDRWILRRAL